MTRLRGAMLTVVIALVALIITFLGLASPSSASGVPQRSGCVTSAYDSHHGAAASTSATAQRALPAAYGHYTPSAYNADGLRSLGASARPNGRTTSGIYDYGDVTRPVQIACGRGAEEQVGSTELDSVVLQRSDAAANGVSRLVPAVDLLLTKPLGATFWRDTLG